MNNAFVLNENPEPEQDIKPMLREKLERLIEIVEALQNIAGSNYWSVLQNNIFGVDLERARSLLEKEESATEMYRLQGEIRGRKKFNLEKLLTEKRAELEKLKNQING